MQAKNIVIAVLALALIGAVSFLLIKSGGDTVVVVDKDTENTSVEVLPVEPDGGIGDGAEAGEEPAPSTERPTETLIGSSVEGRELVAHHFGNGDKEILLVAGVHGGYSPNTAALGQELVTFFTENTDIIPKNLSVTVVPLLNPDGATKEGSAGRFNANEVDLNRNFDCDWSAKAMWRSEEVSGGTEAFSEPEAAALRDYVEANDPIAAVVWFSAEGKVYPSACGGTPSKAATELAATFASAAGYPAAAEFDAYPVTGDMVNWMAKQGIPAISVLLTDHKNPEWMKNESGIKAVLAKYAE
ncbi:MAG: hypothetical protein KBC35_04200 [Candidatus Pacebacteria bacterium]|nr:hypothetical protein [Candidatus Paceibacterota bacterium]